MILFFDTETTGLPDFNKRARDPSQPHIVQLAALLTDDNGDTLESHNVIVRPEGWTIPKEASDIHGITQERAMAVGLPAKLVAGLLLEMIRKQNLLVAHNIQFDKFLSRIAMRRHELLTDADDLWWKSLPQFCTMKSMTNLCRLPGNYGFKWPKLSEAYKFAFNKDLNGAHDAMVDILACKELYFWLQKRQESDEVPM
jgi:DNA polymerase III subunit epsilon